MTRVHHKSGHSHPDVRDLEVCSGTHFQVSHSWSAGDDDCHPRATICPTIGIARALHSQSPFRNGQVELANIVICTLGMTGHLVMLFTVHD